MAAIVTFDATLKAKSKIRFDRQKYYQIHVKYLSKLKYFFMFLYLFLDPLIMTPDWCIEYANEEQKGRLTYDC